MNKVSMIMPCFNSAAHIDNMMRSVMDQDYPYIEIIAVEDGSADATLEKLIMWQDKFIDKGHEFIIHKKNLNEGAAAAVNTGLKLFTGDYVCFPDSDDWMYPGYASEFVKFLDENSEYGWAKCNAEMIMVDSPGSKVEILRNDYSNNHSNAFYDVICENVPHIVVTMMVRASYLKKCIQNLNISDSKVSQEWQLQLPLSYYGNYGIVDKVLYRYLRRTTGSYGQHIKKYDSAIKFAEELIGTLFTVLKTLPLSEKERETSEYLANMYLLKRKYLFAGEYELNYEQKLIALEFVKLISKSLPKLQDDIGFVIDNFLEIYKYCAEEATGTALENDHQKHAEIAECINLSNTYVMYGAGMALKDLYPLMCLVFGKPKEIWDIKADGQHDYCGVPIKKPAFENADLSEKEHLPFIITVYDKKISREIADCFEINGFKLYFEYNDVYPALHEYIKKKGTST